MVKLRNVARTLLSLVSFALHIAALSIAMEYSKNEILCRSFPDTQLTKVVTYHQNNSTATATSSTANANFTSDYFGTDSASLVENIGIRTWLITYGTFGLCWFLFTVAFTCCVVIRSARTQDELLVENEAVPATPIALFVLSALSWVFTLCWTCVGAALLWGNCQSEVSPSKVNNIMWVVLIFSFVEVPIGCLLMKKEMRGSFFSDPVQNKRLGVPLDEYNHLEDKLIGGGDTVSAGGEVPLSRLMDRKSNKKRGGSSDQHPLDHDLELQLMPPNTSQNAYRREEEGTTLRNPLGKNMLPPPRPSQQTATEKNSRGGSRKSHTPTRQLEFNEI